MRIIFFVISYEKQGASGSLIWGALGRWFVWLGRILQSLGRQLVNTKDIERTSGNKWVKIRELMPLERKRLASKIVTDKKAYRTGILGVTIRDMQRLQKHAITAR